MARLSRPYKGKAISPRAWLPITLKNRSNEVESFEVIIDTGSEMELVLSPQLFDRFKGRSMARRKTNFGWMECAWFYFSIPELNFHELIRGYRSEAMYLMARKSHPDFQGVLGLPILRLGEYGGNKDEFWFQHPHTTGINP